MRPTGRRDAGSSRRISEETALALIRLRKQEPRMPVRDLVKEMVRLGMVAPGEQLPLSTAYRVLRQAGLTTKKMPKEDQRRYEAEYPNDIWQADVMHGPQVQHGGKSCKAYLIAFLDDHSRLVPHAVFSLSERTEEWLAQFQQALQTRGMPRKLYVDNGSAFRSRHAHWVCASLGISLVHSRPYTPQGRGKNRALLSDGARPVSVGLSGHDP